MEKYNHKKIEKKWQDTWQKEGLYKTDIHSKKPKSFVLDMFPYPSGEGLHVGHPKGYIATDVYSRFKKMSGFEILHPMGWDAFGLPAENFAIKNKVHPRVAVEKNIKSFKGQLENLGFNYDWDHEINTTDPEYYKWTQWIFVQLFKKGLAYESHEPINWCPSCQTGLANEDLESDGTCERCDSVVEKRPMRQWILRITDYADRLLEDLELLPRWPGHIKESQRNWIGKSEGAELDFSIVGSDEKIKVFTTRPDTLFGATYMVLAPEHELVHTLKDKIENLDEVRAYIQEAAKKSEMDRLDATKEKTGFELKGIKAINPGTKEEIPVFIADYVLAHYGTGAIMAVPAHDERDLEFATKFNIPVIQVIEPETGVKQNNPEFRKSIVAIVRNKKGELLTLDWGDLGGHLFIGGGVDEDEDIVAAAQREITEETGYKNISLVSRTQTIHHHYFAHSKNVERYIHATGLLFDLVDEERQETALEKDEVEKFSVFWMPQERSEKTVTEALHSLVYQLLVKKAPYVRYGYLANSGKFDGMNSEEAKAAITKTVGGKITSTYRLNDWVFSRQRYWGEPIPIIHCEKCGPVAVPEDQLPVELPDVEHYEPTGTGESPLATIDEWVNTTCPECNGPGKRETNTMPQWAGSSWYYLRFIDPQNNENFVDPKLEKKWMPVDVYVGGDHAVRHLIYARFWHKFLYDLGVVSTKEPFERLEFLGFILAEDGRKMSKRWGNIINPDTVVESNGADTLRVYEMFMSPFENTTAWSTDGLVGAQRFLERVWKLHELMQDSGNKNTIHELHKTIKKVGHDIEEFKFNTAIAQMMTFLNTALQHGIARDEYKTFVQLLAPFAPHMAEEIWREHLAEPSSVHTQQWPSFDESLLIEENVSIAVQVNGKLRGTMQMATDSPESAVIEAVKADERLVPRILGEPKRIVYVPNKLINFVL